MNVLLDHCVPRRFRQLLPGHAVKTAFEMGWSGLKNGNLLTQAAAGGFALFVTVVQNIRFQQNLATLPLSVAVLVAPDNRFDTLKPFGPAVLSLLGALPARAMILIDLAGNVQVFQPTAPPKP